MEGLSSVSSRLPRVGRIGGFSDLFVIVCVIGCAGGSAIELLNEPRIGQADFEMDDLKRFYTDGSEVVRAGNTGLGVTVHG